MTPIQLTRLANSLRSASERQSIGRALVTGLLELAGADAVIAWLPESSGQLPRRADLFIAGAVDGPEDELVTAINGGGLNGWFDQRGFARCVFSSCLLQVGRIAVAWKFKGRTDPGLESELELLTVLASSLVGTAALTRQASASQAALIETEEQLARSQRHRANAEMAAGLVHDFNNCLTTILGLTEVAVESMSSTDPNYEGLVTVRTVALDAAVLVRRLHAVGRRSNREENRELVDLRDVAWSMREITRPRWSRRAEIEGVHFNVDVETGEAPLVHVEVAEIRELLLNLLFNAFDAMPAGGVITIATSTDEDGAAVVSVRDEGAGMSPEVLGHLFEPFFSTKGERGSGLGLRVCRNIAHRYGGTLTVESAVGVGTTFTLRLPAATESMMAAARDAFNDHQPSVSGAHAGAAEQRAHRRVLLVDDHEDVRRSVGDMLRAMGHDVLTAPDGPAALTTAMQDSLDVVITDYGMPGMNGAEVATRLQSVDPHLPVVMITGWGYDEVSPLPGNVTLALGKPVTMKALGEAISACGRMPAYTPRG